MFKFLKKFILGIFLFKKNYRLNFNKNKNLFFSLENIIVFFNLKKFYSVFNSFKKLNLTIVTTGDLKKETITFF
jgi:hypothetical protein